MPLVYEKDGKRYLSGPLSALNNDRFHKGQNRGDKLQAFFNQQGIDFDLGSGTGADKDNIYVFNCTGRHNRVEEGYIRVFEDTNYQQSDELVLAGRRNLIANDLITDHLATGVFTSKIFVFKQGEKQPRILYFDKKGNPALSEQFDKLNLEQMKPKKPGWFATFCHSINENWFSDDFQAYENSMEAYEKFSHDLPIMNASVAQSLKDRETEAKNKQQDNFISQRAVESPNVIEQMNARIDSFLAPDAKGIPEFIQKGIYKGETFQDMHFKYPENQPFSDHEIAIIGYAQLMDPGIAVLLGEQKYLTPQETMMHNYAHLTHDIFYSTPRQNSDRSIQTYNPARQKAAGEIKAYTEGRKEYLAKTLGNAIKAQLKVVNSQADTNVYKTGTIDSTRQMYGILQKDPELMEQSGLTQEELVMMKGQFAEQEIYLNYVKSQAELQKAVRGEIKITEERKEELVTNIVLGKYVRACDEIAMNEHMAKNTDIPPAAVDLTMTQVASKKALDAVAAAEKNNDPKLPELKAKAEDLQYQISAKTTKLDLLIGSHAPHPVIKLLGSDDANQTNKKSLIERIKATDTFKTYKGKTLEELGAIQRQFSDDKNEIDKNIPKLISEIVPPIKKEEKAEDEKVAENVEVKAEVKAEPKAEEKAENIDEIKELD